jgi:3-mercaptopyruvate sulfurtransferase SseA
LAVMKRLLNVSVTILVGWTVLLFLQSIQAYGLAADYERITADELKGLLGNKADIVVVDVRSIESYKVGHIPGAISMPYADEIKARHGELPQDKTIILYCS